MDMEFNQKQFAGLVLPYVSQYFIQENCNFAATFMPNESNELIFGKPINRNDFQSYILYGVE